MRTHHHEDCPACYAGQCDGSGWVDPAYPKEESPHVHPTRKDVLLCLAFACVAASVACGSLWLATL